MTVSLELTCEQTEKIYQEYWRLNNIHVLYSIYQEIKEEISNFIEIYHKFKGENRTPDQISKLIEILQEVSNLEDYKKMLEEIIENYEKSTPIFKYLATSWNLIIKKKRNVLKSLFISIFFSDWLFQSHYDRI